MMKRTALHRKTPLKARRPMKRKATRHKPSKADEKRFECLVVLPCLLGTLGWADECSGRTTVSHFNGVVHKGMAQKSDHQKSLNICEGHHLRGPHSIEGMGLHPWLAKYGSQEDLLELANQMVAAGPPPESV